MQDKSKSYIGNFKKFISEKKGFSITIGAFILVVLVLITRSLFFNQQNISYQTSQAEKGTLITSITASGNISSGSSVGISTQATGIVKTVYVKNGDAISQGQKIADITPDLDSQQRQAAAWASYLSALNNEKTAENNKLSTDATMWSAQQTFLDAQNNVNYKNGNTTNPSTKAAYTDLEKQSIDAALIQAQKAFGAAEQKYKDADYSVNSAKAALTSSWLAYQQTSSAVTAPISGTVSGLTLTEGMPLVSTNNSSNSSNSNNVSSQSIGTVTLPNSSIQATVDLSEIDVVNAKAGQKVTLKLDAFPNKTFTGKVLNINTNGTVTSGVTTYPTTILLDTSLSTIYPNMAVNATIITGVKENVLLVPSTAVQTNNGQSTVRIMRNRKPVTVNVEIGDSNDTQTEITSGLKEGDVVVTSSSSVSMSQSSSTSSPFGSNTGRGGGGGGGGGGVFLRH